MLHLSIITPEEQLCRQEAELVTLPGALGPFTVLKGHAPLISHLVEGSIRYRTTEGEEHLIPIRGGFAHIRENHIEVCVEK